MPLIYTLVKRKDMSKDAASGATLYHAQTSITKKLTLNKICTRIENICTASRGEIILVLDGLIKVMNEALSDGESVHLGEFGSFRMVAGSCRQSCSHMPTMLLPYASNLAGGCRLLDRSTSSCR